MKIFNAVQIRQLDQTTIQKEPISSIDLMERASEAFVNRLIKYFPNTTSISIFCGIGNNGGDGLAIARLLKLQSFEIQCFLIGDHSKLSVDASCNYERLKSLISIQNIVDTTSSIPIKSGDLLIDALFGTGLNRPVEGIHKHIIECINLSGNKVVSVDVPSGLYTDTNNSQEDTVICSNLTITFQTPKLSFLLPENAKWVPQFEIVDIGLNPQYMEETITPHTFLEHSYIKTIYKQRTAHTHKGTYGNALIVAGSYGMIGAAVLATQACVRAGAGKTTVHIPSCGYDILQNSVPEAMVWADFTKEAITTTYPAIKDFDAVGMGPGIGTHAKTKEALLFFLKERTLPMVLDADALNIIASAPEMLTMLPQDTVLTPHPKEFDRLFGHHKTHLDRIQTGIAKTKELNIIIVLKNTHTAIINAQGEVAFNSTGNAGLAKGGSGDVLTGIITALMAQKYEAFQAATLGVYLHGLTADLIIQKKIQSQETLKASDLCEYLHLAYHHLGN